MAVTPADFDPYCITVPTDSRLPNSGQQLCGFYDIKPALFGVVDNVRTLASNYGDRTEVYDGVDVSLNVRPRAEMQFSGGLSIGRTVTDACDLVAKMPEALFGMDPLTNTGPGTLTAGTPGSWSPIQNCHIARPWSAATQAKFLAVFPLPWGFSGSAVLSKYPRHSRDRDQPGHQRADPSVARSRPGVVPGGRGVQRHGQPRAVESGIGL